MTSQYFGSNLRRVLVALILGTTLLRGPLAAGQPSGWDPDLIRAHTLRARAGRDARIAIIGGGSSGVTAAWSLQKKGYQDVTLYEAEDRIGGKVNSVLVDGHGIELGAVVGMQDNQTLYDIGRELGVLRLKPAKQKFEVLVKNPQGSWTSTPLDKYWGASSTTAVLKGLLRFSKVIWFPRFRSVFQPGFHDLHPDLVNLTMAQFAKKYSFDAILEPFHVAIYSCGYGAMDEIPALYFLKMMRSVEKVRVRRQVSFGLNPGLWTFDGGYQKLWESIVGHLVGKGMKLRQGAPVTRVTRVEQGDGRFEISVTAGGSTQRFDRILIATPPRQTLTYLDATPEERELFGRVSTFNYHTVVFRAQGLKENAWVNFRDNMAHDMDGHLFTYYNDDPGSNVYTGFQFSRSGQTHQDLDSFMREDVASVGGTAGEVVMRKDWEYFPHVKPEDLDENYYPRLNALQGQRSTFFLGALFAFETTDHCAQFADFLVEQY